MSKKGKLAILVAILVAMASTLAYGIRNTTATGNATARHGHVEIARMSEEVSIRAAGQGAPFINLSDGRLIISPFVGPTRLVNSLARNEAKPLCWSSFYRFGRL
jgi:hypothetical protein